jgi:hypothetical protein
VLGEECGNEIDHATLVIDDHHMHGVSVGLAWKRRFN